MVEKKLDKIANSPERRKPGAWLCGCLYIYVAVFSGHTGCHGHTHGLAYFVITAVACSLASLLLIAWRLRQWRRRVVWIAHRGTTIRETSMDRLNLLVDTTGRAVALFALVAASIHIARTPMDVTAVIASTCGLMVIGLVNALYATR
ncbi:hypothetical protein [Luteibacter sp.]|uniref:hypothetical protein n=1 Tax=Luteibacter sp. TaxID=1886636 RepID=UPI0025BEDAA9|nr:hypothetical protein [Luteibacter sp.]